MAHIKFVASLCSQLIAIVEDRIGMVIPRILCQLINETFFAVREGVATPEDTDIAMKLGTDHPDGPFE